MWSLAGKSHRALSNGVPIDVRIITMFAFAVSNRETHIPSSTLLTTNEPVRDFDGRYFRMDRVIAYHTIMTVG